MHLYAMCVLYDSGHGATGYDSDDLFGDASHSKTKTVYNKAAKVSKQRLH
jgi:hypothetical protein